MKGLRIGLNYTEYQRFITMKGEKIECIFEKNIENPTLCVSVFFFATLILGHQSVFKGNESPKMRDSLSVSRFLEG